MAEASNRSYIVCAEVAYDTCIHISYIKSMSWPDVYEVENYNLY